MTLHLPRRWHRPGRGVGEDLVVNPAPSEVGGARVILWSAIDSRHRPTGACRHIVGGEVPAPFRGLAICQYEGEDTYFLFYCDEKWEAVNDGWHESVDEAKSQAEFEFEGVSKTWRPAVGQPPS